MSTFSDNQAQAALLERLRRQQQDQAKPEAAPVLNFFTFGRVRPPRRSLAASTRQLATLILAQVPLARSLELVTAQAGHRGLRDEFEAVRQRVHAGASFAQALAGSGHVFDRLYVNLVQVGEQGGLLGEALGRLAAHLEQTDALRRKIQAALMYPAIILVVAFASALALLVQVIPLFAEMFRQSNVPLPAPTQVVILVSEFTRRYWIVMSGAVLAGALLVRAALSRPAGRLIFDRTQLALPLIGSLLRYGALARFTKSLGALLASGVPLLPALEATQGALVNRHLEEAIERARLSVSRGESLAAALSGAPGWPPLVAHLVSVGEEAGSLAAVLNHLADYYALETEHLVQTLTAVLEPLMIVIVAIIIGGLLVAMYLPIFSLNEVVS